MRTFFLSACVMLSSLATAQIYYPRLDIQGHRGCRGLMPENTVAAFLMALDSGATTLELDVAISKDRQVVVSHEPWMSAAICLNPEGKEIKAADERKFNLYQMNYAEIKAWDCGSKGNARFPEQQKLAAHKPLLTDVIFAVEKRIRDKMSYEVDYNIEIKSLPAGDNKFHPDPATFCDLVYQLIDQYLPWNRVVIQSFDFRVLKYWHEKYPAVRLAALVDNLKTIDENVTALGFTPSIYSPNYQLVTKNEVEYCQSLKMRIVPWTVNEEADINDLIKWRVDGIISDYPNRVLKAWKKK
jgi:glycerophosphoryl diester phosphodiesterase